MKIFDIIKRWHDKEKFINDGKPKNPLDKFWIIPPHDWDGRHTLISQRKWQWWLDDNS